MYSRSALSYGRYSYRLVLFARGVAENPRPAAAWGGTTRDPYQYYKRKIRELEMQKGGKVPLRSPEQAMKDMDFPIFVDSLGKVIVSYIPPDELTSLPWYTKEGVRQRMKALKERMRSAYGLTLIKRRLKKIEPFKPVEFAQWAQEQYIEASTALAKRDSKALRYITTVTASGELRAALRGKQMTWKFIEQVEKPKIVDVQMAPLEKKENLFAQLLVRMHTRQVSSLHDMAGRLLEGHLSKPRDVVEYIAFERSMQRKGSTWVICGKVATPKPYLKALDTAA